MFAAENGKVPVGQGMPIGGGCRVRTQESREGQDGELCADSVRCEGIVRRGKMREVEATADVVMKSTNDSTGNLKFLE